MKKNLKKKRVKKQAEDPGKPAEEQKKAPNAEEGYVNIQFNFEELASYAQLMSLLAQGLKELALSAAKNNDENSFNILSSRSQLSILLANKLHLHYKLGEPTSKEIH